MKKITTHLKNYRFYLAHTITICFILCSIFIFQNSFIRLIQSFQDLGNSIAYYFCELLGLPFDITVSVTEVPNTINISPPTLIPNDSDLFGVKISMFWSSLWNNDTLTFYFGNVAIFMGDLARYLLILIPVFILVIWLFKRYFSENDKEPNSDSKQLRLYKRLSTSIYQPIKTFFKNFLDYIRDNKYITRLWLIIWLLNFNIFVIGIEFLAFYFYFVLSFDVGNVYIQFYKLFSDLRTMFAFIPLFVWVIIAIYVILKIRRYFGYMRLEHYENKDKGFSNSLGVANMLCGEMGTGKTSTLTDITLSMSVMYRNTAFEKILEQDIKFPYFPFINLENELKRAMEYHEVYNLATAKIWVRKKRERCCGFIEVKDEINDFTYEKEIIINKEKCFDYDYEKYGTTYYDNLKEITLFDMLEIYVQLYFIYVIQSSLIVSNYAIREDNILNDLGNFPMWNSDFFRRDNRLINAYEKRSHILDFDMLRLGKKILNNNIKKDALEFGLIIITEGGKERLNMLGTREMKIKDDETNQKNDLFDLWVKMYRHSATVDNFCFGKIIFDEQRPMSFGADVREICEKIVFIKEKKPTKSTLFLFDLDLMFYEFVTNKFIKYYYEYRFYRSDNTLFIYLFKKLCSKIITHYHKTINIFGYNKLLMESERGTLEGETDKHKYYLCHKKIYSLRYATDCFSDFFFNKSARSYLGLGDIEEYGSYRASIDELKEQNSYFINKLTKQVFNNDIEE